MTRNNKFVIDLLIDWLIDWLIETDILFPISDLIELKKTLFPMHGSMHG